jgi:hypothetical protein
VLLVPRDVQESRVGDSIGVQEPLQGPDGVLIHGVVAHDDDGAGGIAASRRHAVHESRGELARAHGDAFGGRAVPWKAGPVLHEHSEKQDPGSVPARPGEPRRPAPLEEPAHRLHGHCEPDRPGEQRGKVVTRASRQGPVVEDILGEIGREEKEASPGEPGGEAPPRLCGVVRASARPQPGDHLGRRRHCRCVMQWRGSTEALEEDGASHAWRHRLLVDVDAQEFQAEDDRTCHEHRPAQAMSTPRRRA